MKSEQKIFRCFNSTHLFYLVLVCFWVLPSLAFAENRIDEERQNWEVFTNRSQIKTSLLSDDGKILWVGTNGGLEKNDAATGKLIKIFRNSDGLSNNAINALLSDGSGGLWIGTDGGGLNHFKSNGTWEVFRADNSLLQSDNVNALLSDGKGGIFIGNGIRAVEWCSGGLAYLKSDGTWENSNNSAYVLRFSIPSTTEICGVISIVSDENEGLWLGTYLNTLIHLKANGESEVLKLPLRANLLLADGRGGVWFGSSDIDFGSSCNGLGHCKLDGTLEVFNVDNSKIPDNCISSLLSDGKGGIWIGTENGGIANLKSDGTWNIFNIDNSMIPDNNIDSLVYTDSSELLVTTNNGYLSSLKPDGEWKLLGHDDSQQQLPSNYILALSSDTKGGLWIRTYDRDVTHLKADGTWETFNNSNSDLPDDYIHTLLSDDKENLRKIFNEHIADLRIDYFNYFNRLFYDVLLLGYKGSLWIGTGRFLQIPGEGLFHLKNDGTFYKYNSANSSLPDNTISSLLSDNSGGLWIGTGFISGMTIGFIRIANEGGLAHFLLIGTPEQLIKPNSPEITINWFLNSSSLDYQNVKYIELQRSLSQDGVYETVLDESDKPVRFYADYSICPKPRVDNCWVTVEGHSPETKTNSDGSTTKGYTLNTPINDPEWLEGLPRYYRLSAVIEEDGKLVRVANNSEAALITPQVEEKPRVELTLDKNAVAMQPNQKAEITVFVSSLDLFRGDVDLEVVSGEGVAISDNTNTANGGIVETHDRASLRGSNGSENDLSSTISLKSGETKPVLLTIDALSENNQTIKIIPKIQSGYSGKSTSLNVQVGNGTNSMIALSIAHKTKRSRVLDSLTISGNVIPAEAGRSVVISGNNIKKSVDSSNSSESAESLTLTTDENGYFQGTVTPIHAGLLTLTAKSNGITSNAAELFILPARTNIALSSNVNQSTKKGDTLRVQGIITPVRLDGTKVNLDIRYLDPANQDAGLQPQFVGGVEIDANGVFYRDVVVPGNGFINVKASLPETSDYLSINTKLVIPIGQPVGEGIIVVSESGDEDFQTISKSLGSYVYNALKSRNIPAERIKYLGLGGDKIIADFNITTNLAAENFGKTNKNNLHDALTNWATSLFSTDDPYKTPLNLYLIGRVEDGNNGKDENNGFRLNDSEVLTADDLAQYLNEAEEIIKTKSKDNYSEYKGFPVTIVLEGTQSGKWIEKITGNGRIILTSSSNKPIDEGGFAGYDNLGESSFSRYFYQFINYGYDIEGSFAEASYEILKFYRHKQRPVMDADGDGIGTTNYDSYEASGKFIEYRPSGNLRPQIITTNPDRTIKRRIGVSSDESSAGSGSHFDDPILWAIAADPEEEMDGVFCSITDPSNKTVNIEMKRKFDNQNVYEIDLSKTYPNLAIGCYHAVYYAKDKAGNVSLPEQKHLNVISSNTDNTGSVPNPPQFTISVDDDSSMAAVSWSEVSNADGYKLFYCPYPDCPPADIGEIDMGNQREITFDGKGFAFYGAVKAYNSNGFSGWSNVEFFNLSGL